MARVVIGLDVSGAGWKYAVAAGPSKDRIRVIEYGRFDPPPVDFDYLFSDEMDEIDLEEKVSEWAEAFYAKLEPYLGSDPDVVVGIPRELVTIRSLDVPFTKDSRIAQVLPYEAEASLALDADELVFDFYALGSREEETRVLAAAVEREKIHSLLTLFKLVGIDPMVVAPTPLSLHHLGRVTGPAANGVPSRTGYLQIENGGVFLTVTEQDKSVFTASFHASEDEGPSTGAGTSLLQNIGRAIHYLEGFKTVGAGCPPPLKKLFVTGDPAKVGPTVSELEQRLGLEVMPFKIAPAAVTEDTQLNPDRDLAMATSLALALQGMSTGKKAGLNFRKGEFSFRHERKALIKKAIFPATLLVTLVLSIVFSASVTGSSSDENSAAIVDLMKKEFAAYFPGEPIVDPTVQIKNKLDETKAKKIKYEDLSNPSALTVMAALSSAVPDDLVVTITSFDFKGDKLVLKGECEELDIPNKVAKELEKVPIFKKVDLGNVTSGKEKKFTIDIDLREKGRP